MRKIRRKAKRVLRTAYHRLPFSERSRESLKNIFFKSFRIVLRNTDSYKTWYRYVNQNQPVNHTQITIDSSTNNQRDKYINDLLFRSSSKSPDYVPYSNESINAKDYDVKLIAFYLPQFHPIPENDQWWGTGFTEWTNVTKAVPQYTGHYQPHLPDELGFYDLRLIEIMKRQAELAKQYGIYGFCFYHYWFTGKRLLERPVDQLLAHPEIDLPFCLCWANENWSRRWDGEENDILMEQKYSEEDDLNFIQDLTRYLKDRRYIRINGKPVVMVYRPGLFPDFKKTAKQWREYCTKEGIGEIQLLGVSWKINHPEDYGLDGLVEFPPHSIHEYGCELINDSIEVVNPNYNGLIFDYKKYVEEENYLFDTDYKLYKGISPSWDNTARKPNNGTIYHNSSPLLYKKWLKNIIRHTVANFSDDKVVFVNAWNEWAEGAHLEPDRKFGYSYLEATKEALQETSKEFEKNLIIVSHNAHFNGAQLLALNMVKALKKHFGYTIEIILQEGGVLLEDYRKLGNVTLLSEEHCQKQLDSKLSKLVKKNFRSAICNTVITGDLVQKLTFKGIKTISLIHELPGVIKQYNAEEKARDIAKYAYKVVFPSNYVGDKFNQVVMVDDSKKVIHPQGLYKSNKYKGKEDSARKELRALLGLSENTRIVLGVGYADWRKGIDLFCEVASRVTNSNSDVVSIWVGNRDPYALSDIKDELIESVIFIEATTEVDLYYAGADVYLLTSREDPFPSVVMESMNVGVPVIGFKDAGGFGDIVTETTGRLVDHSDTNHMAIAVQELLEDNDQRVLKGNAGRELIENQFYFLNYLYELLELCGHSFKKISAVIPNYNYAHYLPERLNSILNQTYPIYELVVLDDGSKDTSCQVIDSYPFDSKLKVKKLYNEKNSGSVFRQWANGVASANGDYIWIAEADDLSALNFLEEVVQGFEMDEQVVLSYSQSKQMSENGDILSNSYLDYTRNLDPDKWSKPHIEMGLVEIQEVLSIKNSIPNVSGILFKKIEIPDELLEELVSYKIAGDWRFYVWLLQHGKLFFTNKSLNYHRRHTNSVTKSENKLLHYNEVIRMQEFVKVNFEMSNESITKANEYRVYLQQYLGVKDC
ncbi:glycoside hydrolase family 99-like domain-containing protein [Cohnella suwonensis]|uniref:Glycoside hydrolase family 99-like domain-containing protein n=1 Tax=Cohnella suwonensis TaxID=696072 RepID=A0ABW0LXH0_9BACL